MARGGRIILAPGGGRALWLARGCNWKYDSESLSLLLCPVFLLLFVCPLTTFARSPPVTRALPELQTHTTRCCRFWITSPSLPRVARSSPAPLRHSPQSYIAPSFVPPLGRTRLGPKVRQDVLQTKGRTATTHLTGRKLRMQWPLL